MVTETSMEAYTDLMPNIGKRQAEVYIFLKDNQNKPMTNLEISLALNIPINRVTPRIFELREMGFVEDVGVWECSRSGKKAHHWKLK